MSATQFTTDLTDIQFILFDVLKADQALAGLEGYEDFDADTYRSMIAEADRIAREVLHPINGPGDREGCHFLGDGNVQTPKGFKEAWQVVGEGGWIGLTAKPEFGGMGLPPIISMVVNEMCSGAACAFWMYPGLTAAAARIVAKYGPEWMRVPVATQMNTGAWGGTMCLTEAGAGSSVGDNRCKATPTGEEGVYLLEGEKIFISGGDQDLTENIIHLVLARTPGAPTGTKGLSLFIVPKFNFDAELAPIERNDAKVVGIEHKMGINGSATCTIAFGATGPCKGWLVGEEFSGIRIMFEMMNEARIGVGAQGQAIAAAAYNFALAYAKERIQGASVENFKNPEAAPVAIIEHPDVRRMLMTMKCQTEAMRSFLYRMGLELDLAEKHPDPAKRKAHDERVDLLVPILKAYCSDTGFDVASMAVQVYGGYGFTGEYPVEQLVRDGKIFSIYEGTNGIQAMDLLGRKMRMKGGQVFMQWIQDMQALCGRGAEAGFADEAGQIGKALGHVGATAMHLGQLGMQGKLSLTMLNAVPFLRMMGTVCLATELLDQAIVAQQQIAAGGANPHLKGKIANLKFYVHNLLGNAVALGKSIQANDDSCLSGELFA